MKRNILPLILSTVISQSACAERPDNEIPMYGGEHNPTVKKDEWASKRAIELGWKHYYQGNLDTAIKRFNQGWMYDRENPNAFWGFGLIMGQRASTEEPENNLKESIRFLSMASDKRKTDGRILGDLALSYTLLGYFYKSEKPDKEQSQQHFGTAAKLFPQAFKLHPKYPPIVANWSVYYFYTEQYKQAQKKAEEAITMGYRFSPDYMNDLNKKIANPREEPLQATPVE